ncbi:sensor histidine kinase [Erwinia pyrifoliae]|uniref:PAS domain S-box protein n=1 Tax=Erwinia pyrifoliae TaxID=79967 RepID=A0ABY5X6U9_ERWPY|nr:sensor histidine kinase [Erwinia pyrifoliae]AUX71531.1 histidine kinase [Erwinia pyrifoliae]MCA8878249.1 PAS domain S-box protein [Erwinia pyrifoliae]MCT2386014.1 PAS domain S-box protein [Erwinia pyrifoliae]MCU8588400.1 PAS domain S-box protein [Erwinia pyrifoliae]UWS29855.1 PAS domain S-box protein [Erwinia pyrifoliae]
MQFSERQVSASSEPLKLLEFALNTVKDAVYLIDSQTRFFYVNDESCHMLGYRNDELLNMSVSDIDPAWSKEDIYAMWERMGEGGNDSVLTFETHHKTKQGLLIPVEVSSNPFVYEEGKYSMCVVRDMRERKHLEQMSYAREQEFQVLVENSPDMVVRFDTSLNCQYANPAALRHLCVSAEQLRGRRIRELLGDLTCVKHIDRLVSEVVHSQLEAEGELVESDNKMLAGTVINHIRCVPEFDRHGTLISVMLVGRDITAIHYAERKLEDSHMRLRLLARQREVSREEERKRIAREIHDELGQHLTSLRMGISMLRIQFSKDNPLLHERVVHLMGLTDKTIQVVRNVATRLRPNVLDMGLTPALEWLRDEFISRHIGCCCRLITPEHEVRLNDEQATAAFRVAQESLTNISRHAHASEVIILLVRHANSVVLTVRDNGRGFDCQSSKDNAFGLMSMRERGRMLGGSVEIESKVNIGTRISLTIPIVQVYDNNKVME